MSLPGLRDATFDSAGTLARVVWGLQRMPLTEWDPPKFDIKTDKPAIVGEMLAKRRTPGRGEISDGGATFLVSDYSKIVLPGMPKHGGTLITFPILVSIRHPSISVGYELLFDLCRIVGREFPKLDGSEKALTTKCTISSMNVYERQGRGDFWRCLAFDEIKPSAEAQALGGWAA